MEQTITINGVVFVASLNSNNGITKITVPGVHPDPANPSQPFTIEYDPAGTLQNVYDAYYLLVRLGLI